MEQTKKNVKFSYSKLNTYESCAFKFWLQYEQGHFISTPSIAADYGTLVHFCEENIARTLQRGEKVDYEKLKDDFVHLDIPKKDKYDTKGGIMGIAKLKEKYGGDYYSLDDYGMSYHTKAEYYLSEGIYRLENFLKEHPSYVIYGMEQFFQLSFGDYILSGYIDRVFYDTETNTYIIEDIKTKSHPFKNEECITPLQFVLYSYAIQTNTGADEEHIKCYYDLPFCNQKQPAGTKGFIKRGITKIQSIFNKIESGDRSAHSSPLCHWCSFCDTNPNQPEEGKHLCPYYSLWTPQHKTFEVKNKWEGMDKHEIILQKYNEENNIEDITSFDFDF